MKKLLADYLAIPENMIERYEFLQYTHKDEGHGGTTEPSYYVTYMKGGMVHSCYIYLEDLLVFLYKKTQTF